MLDACGGSGNVSELLVGMGVTPVLVDVSPEMIGLWRAKAARLGLEPETAEAEIVDFLRDDPRTWDVVVFSSALHHLENYQEAVDAAAGRLNAGGVLVTIFDPPLAGPGDRTIRRLDWVLFQALHEPRDFADTVRARLRRSSEGGPAIGRLAERYALEGVDDLELRRLLEERGLDIVVHERMPEARCGRPGRSAAQRQGRRLPPDRPASRVMRVSFLVPAYNEAATIGELLDRVRALDLDKQIIVIDDGSEDGTGEIADGRADLVLMAAEPREGRGRPRRQSRTWTATSSSSRTPTWSTTPPTSRR